MQGQGTATSRAVVSTHTQAVEAVRQERVSTLQYRRIVQALKAGRAERKIAESESIGEHLVRRIRALEFERAERQMKAVGVSLTGFLDNVRHLHADIDRGIFEDLQEVA